MACHRRHEKGEVVAAVVYCHPSSTWTQEQSYVAGAPPVMISHHGHDQDL